MSTPIVIATAQATEQIRKILEQEGLSDQAVRVGITNRSASAYTYQLEFVDRASKTDRDTELEQDGIYFYIDQASVADLSGTTLDYVVSGFSAGFKFDNPNKPELLRDPVAAKVLEVIQEKINPGVASHGGHVELLRVENGTAYVKLGGGCQGCGHAEMTVKDGIEAMICDLVPEISAVLDVTDHAAGQNPYYQE